MLIINIIICILSWNWAKQSFEDNKPGWGYWHLFWSAFCAAQVAVAIL